MKLQTEAQFYRITLVTCSSAEEAQHISTTIVKERLAACVNIVPTIQSVYWWEDAVQHESECLLVIKTQQSKIQALADRIGQLHSYTVPEFIVLPLEAGSEAYLKWLRENTP